MSYVNRLSHLKGQPIGEAKLGEPFTAAEAIELFSAYRANPSKVPCPSCGPENIEVLYFIKPHFDTNRRAEITEPEGQYAAVLHCRKCHKTVCVRGYSNSTCLNDY